MIIAGRGLNVILGKRGIKCPEVIGGKEMKVSAARLVPGIISLGIGVFFLFSSWEAYQDFTRTKDYSGRTMGQVTKKHFVRASDGNTLYQVDYLFTPRGGDELKATGKISKQLWDTLKENDKLEIRYDQADPRRSIPAESGGLSLIFAVFVLVLGMVFFVFGWSRLIAGLKRNGR